MLLLILQPPILLISAFFSDAQYVLADILHLAPVIKQSSWLLFVELMLSIYLQLSTWQKVTGVQLADVRLSANTGKCSCLWGESEIIRLD